MKFASKIRTNQEQPEAEPYFEAKILFPKI